MDPDKRVPLLLCVAGLLMVACLAQDPYKTGAWSHVNYPNPRTDVRHCGRRGNASYVCDPNHLITYEEANHLDAAIDAIMHNTECPCSQYACDQAQGARPGGYRIAVVLLKKMSTVPSDASFEAKNNAAKDFAFYLFNNGWRTFGNCDELTIILYSEEDAIFYIMTGHSAMQNLPIPTVSDIVHQSSKVMMERGVYRGLRDAVDRLGRAAKGRYRIGESSGAGTLVGLTSLIAASILSRFL